MFSKVCNFHLKKVNTNLVAMNSTIVSGSEKCISFLSACQVQNSGFWTQHIMGNKVVLVLGILSSNLWIIFHADILTPLVSHHITVGKHQWGQGRELCKTQLRKFLLPWFPARPQSCDHRKPLPFRVSLAQWKEHRSKADSSV